MNKIFNRILLIPCLFIILLYFVFNYIGFFLFYLIILKLKSKNLKAKTFSNI